MLNRKLYKLEVYSAASSAHTLNNPSYRWSPINLQSGSIMPICTECKEVGEKISDFFAGEFDEKDLNNFTLLRNICTHDRYQVSMNKLPVRCLWVDQYGLKHPPLLCK